MTGAEDQYLRNGNGAAGALRGAAQGTLRYGIQLNLLSFVVMGGAGLVLNLLIARFYEPVVLGAFNFILAIFTVAGQASAFGAQYSILRHVPNLSAGRRRQAALAAALLVA